MYYPQENKQEPRSQLNETTISAYLERHGWRKPAGLEPYDVHEWLTTEAALAEIRQLCTPEEAADEQ